MSEEQFEKRLVVIIAADQKHYLGYIEDREDVTCLENCGVVELHDVYQLLMLDQHIVDPQTGRAGGISRGYMLMNIGTANGPLPVLHLLVMGWYEPKACDVQEAFDQLLKQVQAPPVEKGGGPKIVPVGAGALPRLGKTPSLQDVLKGK